MESVSEGRPEPPVRFFSSLRFWAMAIFGPFALAWLVMTLIYASTPIHIDHVEPTITVAAQQWLHGRPLYHPADSPYLYSLLLGPFDYLSVALSLTLCSDPILAAKLAGGFWSLASVALLFFVFRTAGGTFWAVVGLGVVGSELLLDMLMAFWDRPDPALIFTVGLGLAALQVRQRRLGAVLLALAVGLAMGLKIHGALYLLPCLALWFRRHGFVPTVLVAVAGGVFSLAPFLLPGISALDYAGWLRFGLQQHRTWEMFQDNVETLIQLLLPLLLFIGHPRLKFSRRDLTDEGLLLAATVIAGALVCLPASKVGAGWHHLLPFAVYVGYLFSRLLPGLSVRLEFRWVQAVLAIWVGVAGYEAIHNGSYVIWYFQNMPAQAIQADLRNLLRSYPAKDVQMGIGNGGIYMATFYSPWIYREGTPCVVDIGAFMDMKEAGLDDKALVTSLTTEQFRYWLIPRDGEPFSMNSWYDQEPLFDDQVRQAFLQHYVPVAASAFYIVCEARSAAHTH